LDIWRGSRALDSAWLAQENDIEKTGGSSLPQAQQLLDLSIVRGKFDMDAMRDVKHASAQLTIMHHEPGSSEMG